MNANIFSCTVPPLLMLETQIIHRELLQSLCINRCILLATICCADICARADAPVPARTRLRSRALICARPPLLCVQCGSRFDTLASLKLPKVLKKIGKKNFTCKCSPKEDGRTSMSVRARPKPTSKPPCPSN